MYLTEIYKPISEGLFLVEQELQNMFKMTKDIKMKSMFQCFFENPGKSLRPALVLYSAKIVNPQNTSYSEQLVRFACVAELIHSASLIHDDIVDEEEDRRGKKTLHRNWGSKSAVLIGDILISHTFELLASYYKSNIILIMAKCIKEMCEGEIEESLHPISSLEQYRSVICKKTASLMEACCYCGAIIGTGNQESIQAMRNFGAHFGLTYQMMDDYKDQDVDTNLVLHFNDLAVKESLKAINWLTNLKSSVYKDALNDLIQFIIEKSYTRKIGALSS